MNILDSLEKKLDDILIRQAPPLSGNTKKALVAYLPWINAALALVALYTIYAIWQWVHVLNNFVTGGMLAQPDRLTFGVWLSILILAAEALLFATAATITGNRQSRGWRLMYYAFLLNMLYGLVVFFTDYGSLSGLFWAVAAAFIGLYLLFQVRDTYLRSGRATSPSKTSTSSKTPAKKTARARKTKPRKK